MEVPVYNPTGEFTVFARLPAEIRLMIWEQACQIERIIPILPGVGHLFPITHPMLAIPPVLHVCADSRRVGLKLYILSFHPRLYTNRDRDQLMVHVFFPQQTIDSNLYL